MRSVLKIGIFFLLIIVLGFTSSWSAFSNALPQGPEPPTPTPTLPTEVALSAKDNGRQIELTEGHLLTLSLEVNPSTGYMWEVEEVDENVLRQSGEIEFKPESNLLGAPAKQIIHFQAMGAGQTALKVVYRRPWEEDLEPAKTFSLQVEAVGSFILMDPRGTDIDNSPTTPEASSSVERAVSVADQPQLGLPTAFNWCDEGGCTPVKDQGACGSCWAFGTVGPLESNTLIHDALEKDLSEQYLVSCNTDGWSCSGGWWAHDYHWNEMPSGEPDAGAVYETAFPYTAADDPCNPPHAHHEKIDSWAYVGPKYGIPPVEEIKQAIYDHGPVSVAVCVGSAFQGYKGGVFENDEWWPCLGGVNHAVVLVGWDDSQGNNGVWYLRNSWGEGWGESGYMRIGYGISNVGYSANYIAYPSAPSPTPTPTPTPTPDLVANTSFEEGGPIAAPWKANRGLTLKDRRVCKTAHEGSCSFTMVGTSAKKSLRQVVSISGSAGDTFTLWGWSKARKPLRKGGAYCLQAKVFHTDGTKKTYRTCFAKRTHRWQRRRKSFTVAKDYNKIVVSLLYYNQSGKAWFDDVQLLP